MQTSLWTRFARPPSLCQSRYSYRGSALAYNKVADSIESQQLLNAVDSKPPIQLHSLRQANGVGGAAPESFRKREHCKRRDEASYGYDQVSQPVLRNTLDDLCHLTEGETLAYRCPAMHLQRRFPTSDRCIAGFCTV